MKPYYEQDGITIYHADCRDVLPFLETGSIDLVLTDPPYGIALENHGREDYNWTIIGDESTDIGNHVLTLCRDREWPLVVFASPMKPWHGVWRQYLVWDKGPGVGGGGDVRTCWKFTWELIQIAGTPPLNGKRDSAVLRYWIRQRDYSLHPTQKPVDLLSYLIAKTSQHNSMVIDPFMGSGSTLVAAKRLGRRAIGIEIEERYCEIAAKRLQQAVLPLGVTS